MFGKLRKFKDRAMKAAIDVVRRVVHLEALHIDLFLSGSADIEFANLMRCQCAGREG